MTDEKTLLWINSPAKLNKKSLTSLLLNSDIGIFVTTYIRQQKEAKIHNNLLNVEDLINHGQFNDAIRNSN